VTQLTRILERLREGPLRNIDMAHGMNILNYKARIDDLRDLGYNIEAVQIRGSLWEYVLHTKEVERDEEPRRTSDVAGRDAGVVVEIIGTQTNKDQGEKNNVEAESLEVDTHRDLGHREVSCKAQPAAEIFRGAGGAGHLGRGVGVMGLWDRSEQARLERLSAARRLEEAMQAGNCQGCSYSSKQQIQGAGNRVEYLDARYRLRTMYCQRMEGVCPARRKT